MLKRSMPTTKEAGNAMLHFLMLDQPTQVYFPSEKIYQQADGSIEDTEKDADLEAVHWKSE